MLNMAAKLSRKTTSKEGWDRRSRLIFVKQWCDAADLMQLSAETRRSLAAENNINLSILSGSAQIWAEPDRSIQKVVNLFSAIKFSQAQSTVTVSIQDLGDRVLFELKDQGRGIPANQLENIFGRFHR